MPITINWATKVIYIPQSELTFVGGTVYELDVDAFRLALKNIEDGDEGMGFPDTHRHNTAVTLSGVTYARTFEIINGYTVTFEDTGLHYTVRFTGANHNIADVTNHNSVNLVVGNAAGLISVSSGSGLSPSQAVQLEQAAESWSTPIEGSITAQDMMRVMMAVLAGRAVVSVDGTVVGYKDITGVKDRVLATVDLAGNRTAISLDPS